jgi:hypothetical protein
VLCPTDALNPATFGTGDQLPGDSALASSSMAGTITTRKIPPRPITRKFFNGQDPHGMKDSNIHILPDLAFGEKESGSAIST